MSFTEKVLLKRLRFTKYRIIGASLREYCCAKIQDASCAEVDGLAPVVDNTIHLLHVLPICRSIDGSLAIDGIFGNI